MHRDLPIRARSGIVVVAVAMALGGWLPAHADEAAPETSVPAPECDPLDTRLCFLPYPSNFFTVPDERTATGIRVNLPVAGAPLNAEGVPIDVSEWNRNDGFSPNTTILTHVRGLDAAASGLPSWTDLESSLGPDAPVVIVDLDTSERVPLWAELDSRASGTPDDQLLTIHPAVVLTEGHHYAVALRALVDADGAPIEPGPAFAAIRDATATDDPATEQRRAQLDPVLDALTDAGIERSDLVLAWDFTVASTDSITGRMVHIRDQTLAELGDSAPEFTITDVVDNPTNDEGDPRAGLARTVTGTFTVPNWLTGDGSPGQGFNYAVDTAAEPDAVPDANGTVTATFQCNIPESLMSGWFTYEPGDDVGAGPIFQYGHGLLGSEDEINAGNQIRLANMARGVICATKWAGMSEDDIPNAVNSLTDFSNFPTLVDRLQQGVLNQLVFTRLLLADDGLASDPAFQRGDGSPLIDNRRVVYNGNSQGAIMGLMVAGVSTDIDRFVLGVAGMNYGLLLPRSVDFDTYESILEPAYPSVTERTLIIAMIQMLWDRGEGAGYVNHVTSDPLPGTPAKTVLVHVALGDWQVSELSAFIEARALDLPIHRPVAADGRTSEIEPGWGLGTLEYPTDGGGLIIWDSGSDPIPIPNEPPRTSRDPHEDPRANPHVQLQIVSFLLDGQLVDVCGAGPCTAEPVD